MGGHERRERDQTQMMPSWIPCCFELRRTRHVRFASVPRLFCDAAMSATFCSAAVSARMPRLGLCMRNCPRSIDHGRHPAAHCGRSMLGKIRIGEEDGWQGQTSTISRERGYRKPGFGNKKSRHKQNERKICHVKRERTIRTELREEEGDPPLREARLDDREHAQREALPLVVRAAWQQICCSAATAALPSFWPTGRMNASSAIPSA